MRIAVEIDEGLLRQAMEATGIRDRSKLVEAGLKLLIQRETARRLAARGGTLPNARAAPRRRWTGRRGR